MMSFFKAKNEYGLKLLTGGRSLFDGDYVKIRNHDGRTLYFRVVKVYGKTLNSWAGQYETAAKVVCLSRAPSARTIFAELIHARVW